MTTSISEAGDGTLEWTRRSLPARTTMTAAGPRDHDHRHAKTTVDSCPLQTHAESRQHEHAEVLEHRSLVTQKDKCRSGERRTSGAKARTPEAGPGNEKARAWRAVRGENLDTPPPTALQYHKSHKLRRVAKKLLVEQLLTTAHFRRAQSGPNSTCGGSPVPN